MLSAGIACVLGLAFVGYKFSGGFTPDTAPGQSQPQVANADGQAQSAPPVPAVPIAPPEIRRADFAGREAGADVRLLADWIVDSGNAKGRPFALVDKRQARVYLFDGEARLQADSPVLLGAARGDDSVPGIGERPIAQVKPHERTTPAGRFAAEPGRNSGGEDIIWVDYDAAVSMHRVRASNAAERRLQRLASATPADNRISYGCINVPAAFYDAHIKPLMTQRGAVIYVLPEVRSSEEVFGAYDVAMRHGTDGAARVHHATLDGTGPPAAALRTAALPARAPREAP